MDYSEKTDELDSLMYEMESLGIVTFNTVVVQGEQNILLSLTCQFNIITML